MVLAVAMVAAMVACGSGDGGDDRATPTTMTKSTTETTATETTSRPFSSQDDGPTRDDHWHAAIGFDVCGTFVPDLQSDEDPLGIHTHGDGVIHVHPFSPRATGSAARLRLFLRAVSVQLDADSLRLPGGETMRNGMQCNGEPASVRVKVWDAKDPTDEGRAVTGDATRIRLRDFQSITVAFVSQTAEIRRPPSQTQLYRLSDVAAHDLRQA